MSIQSKNWSFQLLNLPYAGAYFCISKLNKMNTNLSLGQFPANTNIKNSAAINSSYTKPIHKAKDCKNRINGYCTKSGRICPLSNLSFFNS
jgi:hypothetical protein